jgi:hypothetical protein
MKAKELDKKFDSDQDVSGFIDIDKARRPSRMSNVLKEPHTDKPNKVSSK